MKWINELEYGKGCYDECDNDNLDLKTTDESSGNELETESDNDSAPKEKTL